ncbi:MAG: radical SAM protein [Candidatus Eremiobacteraeota bacterium]|nr:radical SAM protein [Candidatus Eremiobacteraeota bacterium]
MRKAAGREKKRFLLVEAQKLHKYYIPGYDMTMPSDVVQPLGLVQLASVIQGHDPEARVKILDLRLFDNDFSSMPPVVREFRPDFIGFRSVSRDGPFMAEMIKMMRYLAPDALLVGGGPHVTAVKGAIMDEAPLDYAIYGEGEGPLIDLLISLREGGGFERIAQLIYRDPEGTVRVNPRGEHIADLDSLPLPAWNLLDHESYFQLSYYPQVPVYFNARRKLVSIFTSRGCPYHCIFCHDIFGKKFRARSPRHVVDEIEYLYRAFGIRQFDIRDDIFNFDRERVMAICGLIAERGLRLLFSFPNGLRADLCDEELILAMKKAGLFRVTYALETASPRLQRMIRKNIDLEKLRHIVRFTSAQGILTNLFVMLGFPTETRQEMMMTFEYCLDPAIDIVHPFTVQPFEGTEMTEMLRREGVDISSFRERYEYLNVEFSLSELVCEEVEALRTELLARFFTVERLGRTMEKLRAFRGESPPGQPVSQ